MSIFFLNIIFTNLFYLILGKFLITKLFNLDFKTPIDYAIMGIIGTYGVVKGVQIAGPPLMKTMGKISNLVAGSRPLTLRKKLRGTAARPRRSSRLSR